MAFKTVIANTTRHPFITINLTASRGFELTLSALAYRAIGEPRAIAVRLKRGQTRSGPKGCGAILCGCTSFVRSTILLPKSAAKVWLTERRKQ